jgi:hypothetical protein
MSPLRVCPSKSSVTPMSTPFLSATDVAETVVLAMVSELPPAFRPSMVTLSAPLKSISGEPATIAPEIVRAAPPDGLIPIEV